VAENVDPPEDNHSFGVYKPVGHLVISFPTPGQADTAFHGLADAGVTPDDVHRYTDLEMIEQIDRDIASASPLASLGQELNLVRAQRELAVLGYHWLVVRAGDDDRAARIAGIAAAAGAERAQLYGHFIIEELIDRPGHQPQVAESPDRGLDAQTPSGKETDAGALAHDARPPRD
jgi:hypothetical protein